MGNDGEAFLLSKHPNLAPAVGTRLYDLVDTAAGTTIEVKTDTYDFEKTPNFFMEQFTRSGDNDSPGGPWRALRDNVKCFVYLFMVPRPIAWWFTDVTALVDTLDAYLGAKRRFAHVIRNNGWSGHGYCVPRTELDGCPGYKVDYDEGR